MLSSISLQQISELCEEAWQYEDFLQLFVCERALNENFSLQDFPEFIPCLTSEEIEWVQDMSQVEAWQVCAESIP